MGTFIVAALLVGAVFIVVYKMRRDRKSGKSCCGSCDGCHLCEGKSRGADREN